MGLSIQINKAKGSADTGASDHIERKTILKNADSTCTHLNRELVEFPDSVSDRTEAISYRIRRPCHHNTIVTWNGRRENWKSTCSSKQRQAEQQLNEVKQEIESEKLEVAKSAAKAAFVAEDGSLLDSNRLESRNGRVATAYICTWKSERRIDMTYRNNEAGI